MFVRVVLPLIALGLMIYALADVAGSTDEDRNGLPRWLWIVLIVFLPLFGPIAWIVTRTSRRRAGGQAYGSGSAWGAPGRAGRPGRNPRRPSRPVAPDDDPDFIWRLEQERRRRQRGKGSDGTDDNDEDGSPDGSGTGTETPST